MRKNEQPYRALGIMSGTSLDGLDLALCRFTITGNQWTYEIEKASTLSYPDSWLTRLSQAHQLHAAGLLQLHNEYGKYIGEQVNRFISSTGSPDLVASHGHTVFHRPSEGLTFQLGSGAMIAATCGITTVCDFRTFDVALGGQGAPLVPIGDDKLFGRFDYCLNLGGFANISCRKEKMRIAYDICPVNIVLNYLAGELGYPYDKDGTLGRNGKVIEPMLSALDALPFYKDRPPKSLGREWFEENMLLMAGDKTYPLPDKLSTMYRHIANQIAGQLEPDPSKTVLITGGGALNIYLIEKLKESTPCRLILPCELLVQFKEAVIFAFLGVLKLRNEINCLSTVTGARKDSSSGLVYG